MKKRRSPSAEGSSVVSEDSSAVQTPRTPKSSTAAHTAQDEEVAEATSAAATPRAPPSPTTTTTTSKMATTQEVAKLTPHVLTNLKKHRMTSAMNVAKKIKVAKVSSTSPPKIALSPRAGNNMVQDNHRDPPRSPSFSAAASSLLCLSSQKQVWVPLY